MAIYRARPLRKILMQQNFEMDDSTIYWTNESESYTPPVLERDTLPDQIGSVTHICLYGGHVMSYYSTTQLYNQSPNLGQLQDPPHRRESPAMQH